MISSAVERVASPAKAGHATSLRVECVSDSWGFTALRPQWNELLRVSSANGPFLTWEWLHTWWRHLAAGAELRIIVVREDQTLIAIAPLLRARGTFGWFEELAFLGTGHAGSDYLDLIAREGREADAVRAIARFLKNQNLTVRLTHLPPASVGALLAAQLGGDGWTTGTAPDGVCPVIPLAGHTWDSFLATLGSSHRANIRRRVKALTERFGMQFERVTADADRREALAALAAWHADRYENGGTAFTTPALRAFHDEATRRALGRDWLRMYVMRIGGKPAAVMYGFLYNRQFYFYQHGFDEQYRQHSAGLALMALSIRAAIDEGAETFDMLWGTESYKSLWTGERRALQQVSLFPPHFSGRLHRRAIQARRQLGALARTVLSRGTRGA